jgi:hypothetical protein
VRRGNQTGSQQLREEVRIQPIRLDLRGGDRFQACGMSQRQFHAHVLEQIGEPIPEARRFDDRLMRAGELREIGS